MWVRPCEHFLLVVVGGISMHHSNEEHEETGCWVLAELARDTHDLNLPIHSVVSESVHAVFKLSNCVGSFIEKDSSEPFFDANQTDSHSLLTHIKDNKRPPDADNNFSIRSSSSSLCIAFRGQKKLRFNGCDSFFCMCTCLISIISFQNIKRTLLNL